MDRRKKIITQETKKSIKKSSRRKLSQEGQEILDEIERIKNQLNQTRQNFDLTTDEVLIDSYIFEIIALNKKYQYFLKLAKSSGLIAEGFEKIG